MRSGRMLAFTFWIPLASLAAVELYASRFDGWGAWATAPLFLIPLLLGFVIAGAGAFQCIADARAGALRQSTLVFTGIAALPVAWLLVRRHFL